ncbi:hypothetical protein [Halobacteriovorax sp. ZH2_bin.1]|uniref:hypothetical protein n=1 Tax=unclassified Halobacteriovorax TaxID=2639665 RepID=UPI00371066E2
MKKKFLIGLFFSTALALNTNADYERYSSCFRAFGQNFDYKDIPVGWNDDGDFVLEQRPGSDIKRKKNKDGSSIESITYYNEIPLKKGKGKEEVTFSIKRSKEGDILELDMEKRANRALMKWYDKQQSHGNMIAHEAKRTVAFEKGNKPCQIKDVKKELMIGPMTKDGWRAQLTETSSEVCRVIEDYLSKNDDAKKCLEKDFQGELLGKISGLVDDKQEIPHSWSKKRRTEYHGIMSSVISHSNSLNKFLDQARTPASASSKKSSAIYSIVSKCEELGIMDNIRNEKRKNIPQSSSTQPREPMSTVQ